MDEPREKPLEDADFDYIALQHRFPAKFVVRRGNEVLLSADSYEELAKRFENMDIDWDGAVIQYVESPDRVVAY